MELSKKMLQRLQSRRWKHGTLEGLNRLREKLYELEGLTAEEARIERAFVRNGSKIRARARAELRKKKNASGQRLHYSLPVDNEGRDTVIATDAFDRRHSFTY